MTKALGDASRDVRASARAAVRALAARRRTTRCGGGARSCVDDPDWAVREQLAASLGELPPGPRETALAALLEKHANDPVVVDAALSGLRGSEVSGARESAAGDRANASARNGDHDARGDDRVQCAGCRDASAVRCIRPEQGADVAAASHCSARRCRCSVLTRRVVCRAGADARVPRRAMRHARPVLAPVPALAAHLRSPARAAAKVFPLKGRLREGGGGVAAPRLRRRSCLASRHWVPSLATRESLANVPRACSRASSGRGSLALRAPVAPLTAEEQQRFNEGRDIYSNLCVACHQPDGRGREKLAPSILGSEFALGPPAVPVRVLMNGKEGAVGLMPPLGAGLTDQQIAAVLTYIRREWGQAGSPD